MAELKNMTVRALRDVARKVLGRGHSRLRTKRELVAALQSATKNVSGAAGRTAAKMKAATGRIESAAKAVEEAVDKAVVTARAQGKAVVAKARRATAKLGRKKGKQKRQPTATSEPPAAREPAHREEPDADGYFVARVRGEDAAREAPHPMTESAPEVERSAEPPTTGLRPEHHFEEGLGDLPPSYGDDAFIALPRDPRTLYLYWDHRQDTVQDRVAGLSDPRAQIWVLAQNAAGGWDRVRAADFALESRSYYIHDLEPGRVYHAEIHLVDRTGQDRVLSSTSNDMLLPPFGPSPVIDDKFMRIPWGEPLARILLHTRQGGAFPEELRALLANLSDWSRFVGPTWGSGSGEGPAAGPGGAGGPGGRPSGPSGGFGLASSPSSPWGSPWSSNGSGSGGGG